MSKKVYAPGRQVLMRALGFGAEGEAARAVEDANPLPVKGTTPRVTAFFDKPADNTAYTAGDHIAGSLTAGLVQPLLFNMPRPSGRISGGRAVVTAASGTVVFPAFDLLLFRPEANVPFADGGYPADNGVMNITAAAMRELVAVIPFSATAWRNQSGASAAAGLVGYQPGVPVLRPFAPFNLVGLSQQVLRGVLQAQSWNPGNVGYRIDFALDVDCD